METRDELRDMYLGTRMSVFFSLFFLRWEMGFVLVDCAVQLRVCSNLSCSFFFFLKNRGMNVEYDREKRKKHD